MGIGNVQFQTLIIGLFIKILKKAAVLIPQIFFELNFAIMYKTKCQDIELKN